MSQDFTGIDGDTVRDQDGNRTRLIGIDTPEKGEPGSKRAAKVTDRFASKSDAYTSASTPMDTDKYGRDLRYMERPGGKDLGEKLIRKGLAVPAYDSESNYQWHRKENAYRAIREASMKAPSPRKKNDVTNADKLIEYQAGFLSSGHPLKEVTSVEALIDAVELQPGMDPDGAMTYMMAMGDRFGPEGSSGSGGSGNNYGYSDAINGEMAHAIGSFNQAARANGVFNNLSPSDLLKQPEDPSIPNEEQLGQMEAANREAEAKTRDAEEVADDSIVVDFFQGLAHAAWAVFEAGPDAAAHMVRTIGGSTMEGDADGISNLPHVLTQTKAARMIGGWAKWATTQDYAEAEELLDWGGGWFFEYDSPAALAKRELDAASWGFDPGDKNYAAIEAGVASPGEMLSWNRTGSIHNRGWLDGLFYLADPTLYIGAGAIRGAVTSSKNLINKVLPGSMKMKASKADYEEFRREVDKPGTPVKVEDDPTAVEVISAKARNETDPDAYKYIDFEVREAEFAQSLEESGLTGETWGNLLQDINETAPEFGASLSELHTIATRSADEAMPEALDGLDSVSYFNREHDLWIRSEAVEIIHKQVKEFHDLKKDVSARFNQAAHAEQAAAVAVELRETTLQNIVNQMHGVVEQSLIAQGRKWDEAAQQQLDGLTDHFKNLLTKVMKLPDSMAVHITDDLQPMVTTVDDTLYRFDVDVNPEYVIWETKMFNGPTDVTKPDRYRLLHPLADGGDPLVLDTAPNMENLIEKGLQVQKQLSDIAEELAVPVPYAPPLSIADFPSLRAVTTDGDQLAIGPRTLQMGDPDLNTAHVLRMENDDSLGNFRLGLDPLADDSRLVDKANILGYLRNVSQVRGELSENILLASDKKLFDSAPFSTTDEAKNVKPGDVFVIGDSNGEYLVRYMGQKMQADAESQFGFGRVEYVSSQGGGRYPYRTVARDEPPIGAVGDDGRQHWYKIENFSKYDYEELGREALESSRKRQGRQTADRRAAPDFEMITDASIEGGAVRLINEVPTGRVSEVVNQLKNHLHILAPALDSRLGGIEVDVALSQLWAGAERVPAGAYNLAEQTISVPSYYALLTKHYDTLAKVQEHFGFVDDVKSPLNPERAQYEIRQMGWEAAEIATTGRPAASGPRVRGAGSSTLRQPGEARPTAAQARQGGEGVDDTRPSQYGKQELDQEAGKNEWAFVSDELIPGDRSQYLTDLSKYLKKQAATIQASGNQNLSVLSDNMKQAADDIDKVLDEGLLWQESPVDLTNARVRGLLDIGGVPSAGGMDDFSSIYPELLQVLALQLMEDVKQHGYKFAKKSDDSEMITPGMSDDEIIGIITSYLNQVGQDVLDARAAGKIVGHVVDEGGNEIIEVSTKGDKFGKRFSAFNAKIVDPETGKGTTIELLYQRKKGYKTIKEGKGKPAKDPDFDYYNEYKALWREWTETPVGSKSFDELVERVRNGARLNDQFANTQNNQARALTELIEERLGTVGLGEGAPAVSAAGDFVQATIAGLDSEFQKRMLSFIQVINNFDVYGSSVGNIAAGMKKPNIKMADVIEETAKGNYENRIDVAHLVVFSEVNDANRQAYKGAFNTPRVYEDVEPYNPDNWGWPQVIPSQDYSPGNNLGWLYQYGETGLEPIADPAIPRAQVRFEGDSVEEGVEYSLRERWNEKNTLADPGAERLSDSGSFERKPQYQEGMEPNVFYISDNDQKLVLDHLAMRRDNPNLIHDELVEVSPGKYQIVVLDSQGQKRVIKTSTMPYTRGNAAVFTFRGNRLVDDTNYVKDSLTFIQGMPKIKSVHGYEAATRNKVPGRKKKINDDGWSIVEHSEYPLVPAKLNVIKDGAHTKVPTVNWGDVSPARRFSIIDPDGNVHVTFDNRSGNLTAQELIDGFTPTRSQQTPRGLSQGEAGPLIDDVPLNEQAFNDGSALQNIRFLQSGDEMNTIRLTDRAPGGGAIDGDQFYIQRFNNHLEIHYYDWALGKSGMKHLPLSKFDSFEDAVDQAKSVLLSQAYEFKVLSAALDDQNIRLAGTTPERLASRVEDGILDEIDLIDEALAPPGSSVDMDAEMLGRLVGAQEMTNQVAAVKNYADIARIEMNMAKQRADEAADMFAAQVDDIARNQNEMLIAELDARRTNGAWVGDEKAKVDEFENWYQNEADQHEVWKKIVVEGDSNQVPFGMPGTENIPPGVSPELDRLRASYVWYNGVTRNVVDESARSSQVLESALQHLFNIRGARMGSIQYPAIEFFKGLTHEDLGWFAQMTNFNLEPSALNRLADADSIDKIYDALGHIVTSPTSGMDYTRGVQSHLKRTVMAKTRKNPDAMQKYWYEWRSGLSKYVANRRWSSVPWAHLGVNAQNHKQVMQAVSWGIGDLLRFNPTTGANLRKGKRRLLTRKSGGGYNGITEGTPTVYKKKMVGDKEENVYDEFGNRVVENEGTDDLIRKEFDLEPDAPIYNHQVHDYWLNRMIEVGDATNPAGARRNVWNELMTDMVYRGARAQKLSPDLTTLMVQRFRLVRNELQSQDSYLASTLSTKEPQQAMSPGFTNEGRKEINNLPLFEGEFSDYLVTPDWRELRKAMKKIKFIDDNQKVQDSNEFLNNIAGPWFDQYFRTSVLAFRGSYIARNLGEMQGRMLMDGLPNLFRNPMAVLALSMNLTGEKNRLPKKVKEWLADSRFAEENIDGLPFESLRELDEQEWNGMVGDFESLNIRTQSRADPGVETHQASAEPHLREYTWKPGMDDEAKKYFWTGVKRNLLLGRYDRIGEVVYWVTRYGDDVSAFKKIADEGVVVPGKVDEVTGEQLYENIEFPWMQVVYDEAKKSAGVGTVTAEHLREGSVNYIWGTRQGGDYANVTEPILGEFIATGNRWYKTIGAPLEAGNNELALLNLKRQMWGSDSLAPSSSITPEFADSYYNRLRVWSFDLDEELLNILDNPLAIVDPVKKQKMESKLINAAQRAAKKKALMKEDPETQLPYTEQSWEESLNGFRVIGVDPTLKYGWQGNKAGRKLDHLVNAFFEFSAKAEKGTTYLPAFRFKYWEQVAEYVPYMSRQEAEEILAQAEKTLSGRRGATGWKSGVNKFSWREKTLKRIRKGVEKASDDGDWHRLTRAEVDGVASASAKRFVAENFYDAVNRNQTAYAVRMAFPFAQAFVNSVQWWAKGMYRNPKRVAVFASGYAAATGPGSAEGMPWFEDNPSNPENSVIYNDPQTGQRMLGVPLLSNFAELINKVNPVTDSPPVSLDGQSMVDWNTPIESFNLVTQNQMVPGAGPVLQFPMSRDFVQESSLWMNTPEVVKKSLMPFVNVDPDRDSFQPIPVWAREIMSGLGLGFDKQYEKYLGPLMATLRTRNPERYGVTSQNNWLMDEAGQMRLMEDAKAAARGMTFAKGLWMNMYPGRIKPDMLIADGNGELLAQSVVYDFYIEELDRTGSRTDALLSVSDTLGMNALNALFAKSSFSSEATKDAYSMLGSYPELKDQAPTVVSYFYPRGGYDPYMTRWQNEQRDGRLPPDQMAASVNDVMYQMQAAELDRKYIAGEINYPAWEQSNRVLTQERDKHPSRMRSMNGRDVTVESIRRALAVSPTLRQTDAGVVASTFLKSVDALKAELETQEKYSLGGIAAMDIRRELLGMLEEMVAEYPDSFSMVNRVLKPWIEAENTLDDAGIVKLLDEDRLDDTVLPTDNWVAPNSGGM